MIARRFGESATGSRRAAWLSSGAIAMLMATLTIGAADIRGGKEVYDSSCFGCHASGVLQAPKLGDAADWGKREQQGLEVLVSHAIKGYKNMPAKGGNPTIADKEIENAIMYMLASAGIEGYAQQSAEQQGSGGAAPAASAKPPARSTTSGVNSFNRLMKTREEWNLPPAEDGIHDPQNPGTLMLQPPKLAFENLTSSRSGNRVDWVKALENGEISPRYEKLSDEAQPVVMDLNIVREVKGSMPDVVYPHKQHTQWLDCSNCHPAIFIPQKGANQISMASILLGQKCGVCHGKVAFPVSECRRCHSKQKPQQAVTSNDQTN